MVSKQTPKLNRRLSLKDDAVGVNGVEVATLMSGGPPGHRGGAEEAAAVRRGGGGCGDGREPFWIFDALRHQRRSHLHHHRRPLHHVRQLPAVNNRRKEIR